MVDTNVEPSSAVVMVPKAEYEALRANQQYLDDAVRNQAIRETIYKEEIKRLRAALEVYGDSHNWNGGREWRGPTDNGWVVANRAL